MDPHSSRLRQDLCQSASELEVRDRAAAAACQPPALSARAARRSAAPARSTAWCICVVITPITTNGDSGVARGGTGIPSCRTSRRPRTRPMAAMSSMASADRCNVSDQPGRFELADAVMEACVQAGIPRNPDFNGAQQEGCGYYQTTTSNRRRWSTAKAYLHPARQRANLVVQTGAHATRVLIENNRAAGVEYHTGVGSPHCPCTRRGHRLGRCLWLAAASAAVGSWPGTASAGHGHQRWSATCRRWAPICTTISTPT